MKRTLSLGAVAALTSIAALGCTVDESEELSASDEAEVVQSDPLAEMLQLGALRSAKDALRVRRFYDKTVCRLSSAGLSIVHYERGAIYYARTPFGRQPLCVDVVSNPGTDSPTFTSISGGVLHAAIAWSFGRLVATEPDMGGKLAYEFERGVVVTSGAAYACDNVPTDQRSACKRDTAVELATRAKTPPSAKQLAAFDDFVSIVRVEGPPPRDEGELRVVTFIEQRSNLGAVGSRPVFRNDEITYSFERGYAFYNMRTGGYEAKNTKTGRSESGDTGIALIVE